MNKGFIYLLLFNIVIVFGIVLLSTKLILVKSKNNKIDKFKKYTVSIK